MSYLPHSRVFVAALLVLGLLGGLPFTANPVRLQSPPAQTIDVECVALAYAPDGRLAYAVRRIVKSRRTEMQRDDIFLVGPDKKAKRIVNGERLVEGGGPPFSYTVRSMRWSPDGERLTAELLTRVMIDAEGNTQDGVATLLLDQTGKEIKIQGADSIIPEGINAAWLGDGVTIGYVAEAVKPGLLFSLNTVRPAAGRGGRVLDKSLFVAVAWDPARNAAVAIQRDKDLRTAPVLVWADVLRQSQKELATLETYSGQLSVSPSGNWVAYFVNPEILEIRSVSQPERAVRLRTAMGIIAWAPDERRLLVKREVERKNTDLSWILIPSMATPDIVTPTPRPALGGQIFRDFALSPDGKWIAVIEPGKRNVQIFSAE